MTNSDLYETLFPAESALMRSAVVARQGAIRSMFQIGFRLRGEQLNEGGSVKLFLEA